jgi:predicted secreted protein
MVPIGVALLASLAVAVPAQAAIGEAEALTAASAQAYAKGMNTGSIEVSSPGAAPYGRARAVFGAEGGSVNPLDETAYTFLFTNGGTFAPDVPVPYGHTIKPTKYLGLILGPTGGPEYVYAGPTAPPIATLGTVVTVKLSSSQASAAARTCKVDELLASALARKHLHTRLASAERSLRACNARHH